MLRTRLSKILIGAIALGGLTAGVAGPASASEPTGQYSYICVGTDGSSYSLRSGEPLSNCKGSYLQKYIGGVQVDTIALSLNGAPANPDALSLDCLVAIVGTGASAYGIVQTAGTGVIAYVGLAASVYGLKACVA